MPWSGGNYKKANFGSNGWTGDASLGIGIEAGRHDTQDDDFASGINNCIAKDGSNVPTANLPMNNLKHTGVQNATARNEYVALGQIQDGSVIWCGTAGGTANALTLTPSPAITTYVAGQRFLFLAASNNTAAATLQISGIATPRNIYLASTGAAIIAGFIRAGALCEVVYDGSQFLLTRSVSEMLGDQFTGLGTSSGTANAIVLTPSVPLLTYNQIQFYSFLKDATANTGACTINISGLGVITLFDREGNAIKAGMLQPSRLYNIYINGGNAYLLNPSSVWQGYTPTWTQGATITYSVQESNYKLNDNNTVTYTFMLTATSAGTAANAIVLTLPVTAGWSNGFSTIGAALITRVAAGFTYSSTAALTSGSPAQIKFFSGSGASGNYVGITPAITIAIGDYISGTVTYRV